MNFTKPKWFAKSLGVVLIFAAAFVLYPFCFSYVSVCAECGAEQHSQEWKLPWTDWTVFKHSSFHATPLSRYLSSSGLVAAHTHNWLFAAGGGNGITCAIGQGRHLWQAIRAPNSARLLESMRTYDGPEAALNFLRLELDPAVSQRGPIMMIALFPTNGFSNKEQYHAWLLDNDLHLDDESFKPQKNM
jgi:hypothetical protein